MLEWEIRFISADSPPLNQLLETLGSDDGSEIFRVRILCALLSHRLSTLSTQCRLLVDSEISCKKYPHEDEFLKLF